MPKNSNRTIALSINDNDGAINDSEYFHFLAINDVLKKHNAKPYDNDRWWEHASGKGHVYIYNHCVEFENARGNATLGERTTQEGFIKECLDTFNTMIRPGAHNGWQGMTAKPGIKSALTNLNASNILIGVNSNSPAEMVALSCVYSGLSHLPKIIIGQPDILKVGLQPKPEPESWGYVAAQLCQREFDASKPFATPVPVIMFEDSGSGTKSAIAARSQFDAHLGRSGDAGSCVIQVLFHPFGGETKINEGVSGADYHVKNKKELMTAFRHAQQKRSQAASRFHSVPSP